MNRKAQVILIAAVCSLALAGAGWLAFRGQARTVVDTQTGRGLMDMTGRAVRLPPRAEHVLSLCTSATDTIAAMHEEARLTAIDEYSRVVEGTDKAIVIGKGSAISKEQVLALKIDLAFVWWFQDDAAAMLEGLGVPVVRIRSGRAAEVPSMIRLVGSCLGRPDAGNALAIPVEEFLQQVHDRASQPTTRPAVYLELYAPFKTVGKDSYMGDLIDLAGGRNIAADTTGSVLLSVERMIQNEPEVILFVEGYADAQSIASRPGMTDLKAVRCGQVHAVPRQWVIAGPRLPQAVARLREVLQTGNSTERR